MAKSLLCKDVLHLRAARRSAQRPTLKRDVLPTLTLANGMAITCCSLAGANILAHVQVRPTGVLTCIHCEVCRCPLDPHRDEPA